MIANGFEDNAKNDARDDDQDSNENSEEENKDSGDDLSSQQSSEEQGRVYEYEEIAGEYALYDSPLENIDELIHIKEMLDAIYSSDQRVYEYFTSMMTEEEKKVFIEMLRQADQLKARELAVNQAFESHDLMNQTNSVNV